MLQVSSKRGYLAAIICLALMVVALGAAAKHSQFESPTHSTHYLKQSVKMVASNDHPAIAAQPAEASIVLVILSPNLAIPSPVSVIAAVAVHSPLLI